MPKHDHSSFKPDVDALKSRCLIFTERLNLISFSLLIISSFIIFVVACVTYSQLQKYNSIISVTIPVGFIIISLFFIIVSLIGIIGIKREMLRLFQITIAFLLILIIIEIGIGGGTYGYRNGIQSKIQQWWDTTTDSNRNSLQTSWNCCGWSSPTDTPGSNCITNSTVLEEYQDFLTQESVKIQEGKLEELEYFELETRDLTQSASVGCQSSITNYFQQRLSAIGAVGLVFAFIQLFALVFCIILYVLLYREKNKSYLEV